MHVDKDESLMNEVEHYEIEWLQDQIYKLMDSVRDLEIKVDQLQKENQMLRHDLNTIENNTTESK
jgi:peptidoglycan hydrolase CwlO-like protein